MNICKKEFVLPYQFYHKDDETSLCYWGKVCNHSIFRHDNFIGCFSADKIKKSVRKYFCFNITIYKNMAEELSCRKPFPKEYIQTSASGNPEDLYH